MKTNLVYHLTGHSESKLWFVFAARYNGHFPGTAQGPGPGWSDEGNMRSDLFSEMNPPEIQKLKQQLVTVSFPVFPVRFSSHLQP